jgi:hypothetical protein
MPLMIFLGFSLAAVINADVKALQEIGKMKKQGTAGLVYFKVSYLAVTTPSVAYAQTHFYILARAQVLLLEEMRKKLGDQHGEIQTKEFNSLFTEWVGGTNEHTQKNDDSITIHSPQPF